MELGLNMSGTKAALIRKLSFGAIAPKSSTDVEDIIYFASFREALEAAKKQIAKGGTYYDYIIRYETPRIGIRTAYLHSSKDIYYGRVQTTIRSVISPTYIVERLRTVKGSTTYFHSYAEHDNTGEPRTGGRLRARRALFNGKKTPRHGMTEVQMSKTYIDAFWIFENFVWRSDSSMDAVYDSNYITAFVDPTDAEWVVSSALSRGSIRYHMDGVANVVDRLEMTLRRDWFGRQDLISPLGHGTRRESYYNRGYGYPSELYEAIVEHGIEWTHSPNAPILVTPEDAVLLTTILA